MKSVRPPLDYNDYTRLWNGIARAGWRHLNIDTWVSGRRYLSLATIELDAPEVRQLRDLTNRFARLIDLAVDEMLADRTWWSALAWPWPAIELARQEPRATDGHATVYGRFDCLQDRAGVWQVIEFNADTPSGGREQAGLEPAIARLYSRQALRPVASSSFTAQLVAAMRTRVAQHDRTLRRIGVVSSHAWLEDMAQATWLAHLLRRYGVPALVGDITDLTTDGREILLRGQPIDGLYRFYPVERLYRHAIFAPLCEAAIDGRLVWLNGLRAFLAQSKACLAWLWMNRSQLGGDACSTIERHLPTTLLARDPEAARLLPDGVLKHVNGREGDSIIFGRAMHAGDDWEARLLEGGYVVQRAVQPVTVEDIEVDDVRRSVEVVSPRFACVGAFAVGGRFSGCYTRLDGPITTAKATYVATLRRMP